MRTLKELKRLPTVHLNNHQNATGLSKILEANSKSKKAIFTYCYEESEAIYGLYIQDNLLFEAEMAHTLHEDHIFDPDDAVTMAELVFKLRRGGYYSTEFSGELKKFLGV